MHRPPFLIEELDTESPMIDSYVQHRIYLKQYEMLKTRTVFEIVPVNFNYQNFIVVTTGLLEYASTQFVFQTYSCGCGPQPTIRGAYFEEVIPWHVSTLCACFAASSKAKERELAVQKVIAEVYSGRLPVGEREKAEVTAALQSQFGINKEISFF